MIAILIEDKMRVDFNTVSSLLHSYLLFSCYSLNDLGTRRITKKPSSHISNNETFNAKSMFVIMKTDSSAPAG